MSLYEQALRDAGLRVTRPRLALLDVLDQLPHADTDSITKAARRIVPNVSHQAIYDGLRALTEAGLVRRVQPGGLVARYDPRVGDNHHHLVCRRCGAIEDVDCAVGMAPCLTPSDNHGFAIDEAEVAFKGLCPACQAAEPPTSTKENPHD